MSCDDCADTHALDGVETPCEECPRAAEAQGAPLYPENLAAWRLWQTGHRFGRGETTGGLQLEPLLHWAEAQGASLQDVEKALALEDHLWPKLKPKGSAGGNPH